MASAHHRWAAGPAAAVDLLGGEDGGVRPGVALACLTRLGTSALKKLCRKRVLQRAGADEASASLASLAFTEKRTEGVEHTALLSLWRHFRLADGDRSGILEPLLEEWTTCSDPERRNLFLILAASFFDASRTNFSACASDVLAGSESEGTRYACVLLLHSIVKETARTHRKTNAEKADCFQELSQTFPDLVAICSRRPCGSASAIPRPAVPTRMVSLASDTILLAVAALASMDQDHGGDPSQALPLPVRVLWERTETLLRLLEMHEEWTAALSSAMPGVLSDSGMVILALEAMRKRVSRMLAFTFREDSEDERHAMTIQAQCWRSWAPLFLFDRRTYLQVARGGGEDETLTLKRATSAIRHAAAAGQATKAKAGDPINTLMINETIFRSVVSMGLVIGLGREESEISETSEEKSDSLGQDRHLEKILDALVGITDSLQLSAVTCGLASRVAAFAAERVARDADDSSAVVDAFVDSVMRSCPSNAPVAAAFIETLLTQSEATAGLLVDKILGHLGQKSDGARVGTALAALGSILSAKAAPNQGLLERTFPEITDLVIHWCSALSVTERVRDQARALLTKLPVAEAVDSLLRTIRSRDEDLPLPCQVLLRFLKQAEPSDYHHIAKRFGSFVVSDRSSAHAERVARLMAELSSDTESGFWPCLLSVLLEASAMDPSNQNFIQMLSALSLQLSNCVDLVRGFVLSSLWDRQGKAAAIASPAPAPPSKPSPPLSLTVFQRLHPLLVLRIVSKHCFDQLVTLGLETRVLADQLVKVSDQDIFGQLIQGMSEEEEDVQVRRVCSELCGKINPNVSFSVLLELLRMAIKDAKLPLARACMYAFCCSFGKSKPLLSVSLCLPLSLSLSLSLPLPLSLPLSHSLSACVCVCVCAGWDLLWSLQSTDKVSRWFLILGTNRMKRMGQPTTPAPPQ